MSPIFSFFAGFNGYTMLEISSPLMKDTNISVKIVIVLPASWWLHSLGLHLNMWNQAPAETFYFVMWHQAADGERHLVLVRYFG